MKIQFKIIILSLILFSSITYAQFPRNSKGKSGWRNSGRREKIEELRIWKMTSFLDLTTEQAIKFFPSLKNHDDKVFKLIKNQHKYLNEISEKCVKEDYDPSDKDVLSIYKKMEKIKRKIEEEENDFIQNKLDYLTNQQKVKYIVFDSRFKSHLLRALREHQQPKQPKGEQK